VALVDNDVPIVGPDESPERAAWLMVHHQAHAVVVVDEGGNFEGVIPSARIAEVLVRAHEQDLARLAGFVHDSTTARLSSTESVSRRLWHRTPWLLIGLAGAFVAASIVRGFESSLAANVELAFFLPGIVYLADAVGTQTETLMVRGLSVGVSVREVVWREVLTGLSFGVLLGAVALPVGALFFAAGDVALVVALALFSASAIATVIAMVLPAAFHHVGIDPAFGSGPLATVIQDLASIVIYSGFATLILWRTRQRWTPTPTRRRVMPLIVRSRREREPLTARPLPRGSRTQGRGCPDLEGVAAPMSTAGPRS
jgi:magnesium transporter